MQRLHLLPSKKVAEELLLIDSSALRKILPEELVDEAWVGKQREELSPNITTMVQHFNSVALLVPTEILAEATPQMRAGVVTAFIKVAVACHKLKNYHSLKAVLAGLQCTPVYRLRRTWKRVPSSRRRSFERLSALMTEEGNCALYRREINLNLQNKVPFVPYLGFFLTQVVHHTCHQKMWERKWLKPSRRNDLTCCTERENDISRSHTDLNSCQTQSGNDLSSAPEYLSLPPSYSLHLHFMPLSQYCNVSSDTPHTSLKFSSLSSLNSEQGLKSPQPSTPSDDGDDQFCRLEDSSLYLTKGNITNDTDDHHVSKSGLGSLGSESGLSTAQCSTLGDDDEDEQFCKLEDSALYLTKVSIIGDHNEDDCIPSKHVSSDHGDTLLSPRLSMVPADVHLCSETKSYSRSRHPTFGFSTINSTRRSVSLNHVDRLKGWHATQVDSVNPKDGCNPKALLQRYQTCSFDCAIGIQSREDIRNLIINYHGNSESENYVLSYQREPQ